VIAISARSTDVFKACVVILVCLLQSSRVRAWLLNVLRWGRPPSRPDRPAQPPAAADRPIADPSPIPDSAVAGTAGPGSASMKATS
jgi:hypothetical protein